VFFGRRRRPGRGVIGIRASVQGVMVTRWAARDTYVGTQRAELDTAFFFEDEGLGGTALGGGEMGCSSGVAASGGGGVRSDDYGGLLGCVGEGWRGCCCVVAWTPGLFEE
jgi:hypothetical protein